MESKPERNSGPEVTHEIQVPRQVRLRHLTLFAVFGSMLALAAYGLAADDSADRTRFGTLRARRLIIEDAAGHPAVELSGGRRPAITVFDDKNRRRFSIGLFKTGSDEYGIEVILRHPNDVDAIRMSSWEEGMAGLGIKDAKDQLRITMGVGSDQVADVAIYGDNDIFRQPKGIRPKNEIVFQVPSQEAPQAYLRIDGKKKPLSLVE